MAGNTHARVVPDVLDMIGNTHTWAGLIVLDMTGDTHIWVGQDVFDMNSIIIVIIIIVIITIIMDISGAPSRVSPRRLQKRLRTNEGEEVGRHTEQCAH